MTTLEVEVEKLLFPNKPVCGSIFYQSNDPKKKKDHKIKLLRRPFQSWSIWGDLISRSVLRLLDCLIKLYRRRLTAAMLVKRESPKSKMQGFMYSSIMTCIPLKIFEKAFSFEICTIFCVKLS